MLKGYKRGQTQCEAVSLDKWQGSPHCWVRCQLWALHERDGLQVCRQHNQTRVVCSWDIPQGERPHWNEWRVPK